MSVNNIKQPIFMCGMMGSGKSTIGKILAKMLNCNFSDLDLLIEQNLKMRIPEIFAQFGENEFRKVEKKLLLETASSAQGVVALGGGSLQDQHLVDHVKLHGWLVFLDCPRSVLSKRLHNSRNRPMLKNNSAESPMERINELIDERLPFYTQAHITIDTSKKNKQDIAQSILNSLAKYEQ
jgi:shikimate kinase